MTHRLISAIIILFTVFACQNSDPQQEKTSDKIVYSNFELSIPEECTLESGNELSKAILLCNKCSPIKIFNFGKVPVSIEANVKRWSGQLDSVININTSFEENQLVNLTKIKGIKNNKASYLYGIIIPSEEGPYYLKTVCGEENKSETEQVIHSLVSSVKYIP